MSKAKQQVLFINPPSIPSTHLVKGLSNTHVTFNQTISMPMGILYLSSMLQRDYPDIEIVVVDLAKAIRAYQDSADRTETDWSTFVKKTLADEVPEDFQPIFTGISILFSTADKSSVYIADAVKERWAASPIVMGGMHATNAVNTLLTKASVDYVCRGEGESIICELFAKLLNKENPEDVEGIIGQKKLMAQKLDSAPLINDLDEIPLPAWDLIDMPAYNFSNSSRARHFDMIEQDGEATIVTTRGCPFLCTFCASWTVHGRKMRYRSNENVLEELRILHNKYQVTSVIPEDDLFTSKKKRIIELCESVYQEFNGEMKFQFPNGLSVATLDADVINGLVKMGMTVGNIAIESGSEYVQRNIIEKKCNLKRAKSIVQLCRDTGMVTRAYFIMGFPGETREHLQETVDYMLQLPADWNVINIAAPLIGTKMYDQLLEREEIDQTYNWDTSFFQERSYDSPEIGAEELKALVYDTNVRVNFLENYNLSIGEYDRAIMLWQDILHAYPNHLIAQYCTAMAHQKMDRMDKFNEGMDKCRAMFEAEDNEMVLFQYKQYSEQMPGLDLDAETLAKTMFIPGQIGGDTVPQEAKKST